MPPLEGLPDLCHKALAELVAVRTRKDFSTIKLHQLIERDLLVAGLRSLHIGKADDETLG
ncbi:MAG: hypothetical protein OHK0039_23980 [Bacteroidia bacterium]